MQGNHNQRKAILFRIGPFPIPNSILERELPKQFPDTRFIVIDVVNEIKRRPLAFVINSAAALWEYGRKIVRRDFTPKEAFLGTTWFFHWVKRFARQKIKEFQPDFTFQTESLWDVSVPGCPNFVYTDHTHLANLDYQTFNPNRLKHPHWVELETSIYQNATTIFTRSSNISRSLEEKYQVDGNKIVMVGAGSNFNQLNLGYQKQDYRRKEILFVGIDWPRKGGPDLVKAFQTIQQHHPDARLTIVGCAPGTGLTNCTETGRIPIEAVSPFYERASIFCLPTKQEPFGIVFLEALHYKLPIVATDIGAIPDFVKDGENGYLVKPEDPAMLADRLIKLLDDAELCKVMGERGFELARSFYNWEKVTQHMAETIRANLKS